MRLLPAIIIVIVSLIGGLFQRLLPTTALVRAIPRCGLQALVSGGTLAAGGGAYQGRVGGRVDVGGTAWTVLGAG